MGKLKSVVEGNLISIKGGHDQFSTNIETEIASTESGTRRNGNRDVGRKIDMQQKSTNPDEPRSYKAAALYLNKIINDIN